MINELVQQGTRIEMREVIIPATYDEEGNILTPETTQTVEVEVPNMVEVYREETAEELAEAAARQAEWEEYEATRPRTTDERLDAYAEETDTALFDLDEAQNDYAAETDAALFDLVDYVASLEARIQEQGARIAELEAANG